MMRGRLVLASAGAVLAVAVLVFCGAASRAAAGGAYTRAQAARGQLVYMQHCLTCHGANLAGRVGAGR